MTDSQGSHAPQSAQETFERLALRVLQGDGLTEAERRIAAGAISAFGKTPSDRRRTYEDGLVDAAMLAWQAGELDLCRDIRALKNNAAPGSGERELLASDSATGSLSPSDSKESPAAGHCSVAAPAHTDHPLRHWDRTCPACLAESPCVVGTTATSIPNPRTGR